MPTTSTSAPLIRIEIVKHQNAGLKISPSCSLLRWNAAAMSLAMSPRIAKTIDVVTSEMQLAMKSLLLSMVGSSITALR